jgi:hypothetical protein
VCGHENESPVWRVLDERERADAMHADTPGLVVVMCDLCGARAIVNDALLLVRSTTVAPLVAVLPWEQLQEPVEVLGDLLREAGDQVPGKPLLAPRVLLPLLLTRDVDADALDPGGAASDVRAKQGSELGDVYAHFLSLAVDQHAEAELERDLGTLWGIPTEQLPAWLAILCVPNSDIDLEFWLTLSPRWCSLDFGPHLAPTLDA